MTRPYPVRMPKDDRQIRSIDELEPGMVVERISWQVDSTASQAALVGVLAVDKSYVRPGSINAWIKGVEGFIDDPNGLVVAMENSEGVIVPRNLRLFGIKFWNNWEGGAGGREMIAEYEYLRRVEVPAA
jgi:hypothetical protein